MCLFSKIGNRWEKTIESSRLPWIFPIYVLKTSMEARNQFRLFLKRRTVQCNSTAKRIERNETWFRFMGAINLRISDRSPPDSFQFRQTNILALRSQSAIITIKWNKPTKTPTKKKHKINNTFPSETEFRLLQNEKKKANNVPIHLLTNGNDDNHIELKERQSKTNNGGGREKGGKIFIWNNIRTNRCRLPVRGNQVFLWDGTEWEPVGFTRCQNEMIPHPFCLQLDSGKERKINVMMEKNWKEAIVMEIRRQRSETTTRWIAVFQRINPTWCQNTENFHLFEPSWNGLKERKSTGKRKRKKERKEKDMSKTMKSEIETKENGKRFQTTVK